MGNTLQSAIPLERNPIGTKAQQNENTCPIRSKEAFVLTGFRSDGPTPEEDRETGGTARLGYLSRGRRVPIYATAFTAATCYY